MRYLASYYTARNYTWNLYVNMKLYTSTYFFGKCFLLNILVQVPRNNGDLDMCFFFIMFRMKFILDKGFNLRCGISFSRRFVAFNVNSDTLLILHYRVWETGMFCSGRYQVQSHAYITGGSRPWQSCCMVSKKAPVRRTPTYLKFYRIGTHAHIIWYITGLVIADRIKTFRLLDLIFCWVC